MLLCIVLVGMLLGSMHGIVKNGIGYHGWYCQEVLDSLHGIVRNGIGYHVWNSQA